LNQEANTFPGGTKSRVNRAGEHVRDDTATPEDFTVIEDWRAAHRGVLNTFQAILRLRCRGKQITVAQRHKRRSTIFGKLSRLPEMQLARMDDVAGCRLIFRSIKELYEFRGTFLKATFRHKRKNSDDKYDYIKRPKKTGYRGIHDVYEYDVNSEVGKHLKGLLVEIQYRTLVQHAWATAVEVIGFITESQPKFEEGERAYVEAMALASEILARAFEGAKGPYPNISDEQLVREFLSKEKDLNLMGMLRGLNAAKTDVSDNRNTILVYTGSGDLDIYTYRDATEALRNLFELEKELPGRDIVLVRADTSAEVRLAFRNYFTDARDFIRYVERGCEKLSHRKVIERKARPRRRRFKRVARRK
jgi:putative GTP pyrophosphokinase